MEEFLDNNLADLLLKNGLLKASQLQYALNLAEENGDNLHDVILAEGFVNPHELYKSIAEVQGSEFADLYNNPCDLSLIKSSQRDDYIKLQIMPWRKDGDLVVIAAVDINEKVLSWAQEKYGEDFKFAITSPYDIRLNANLLFKKDNTTDALEELWLSDPLCSAKDLFAEFDTRIFAFFVAAIFIFVALFPKIALLYIFIISSIFYAGTLLFKTMLIFISMLREKNKQQGVIKTPDRKLPIYTILVPLYKEDKTLAKLVDAIRNLDYPKAKLDVKLIVEEDDTQTIEAVKALKCERIFEMVKVPYSLPRTKPKACNYALRFARGEYVTIYDAEDVPDKLQLKKALYAFANNGPEVVCVQARLNYFNREENILTRMFAIEYSNLFDFMLYGLEAMNIPIPLGGTSNHFKIDALRSLYAWDPYNVTEDADIGLRIAQKGWRAKMLDSITLEECPISVGAWIRQRSRWIKGHMQTYFVHMRRPIELYKRTGLVGFMGFQFVLGAPVLVFIISPFMWLGCLMFMSGWLQLPTDTPSWFYNLISASFVILFFGIVVQLMSALLSIRYNKWRGMMPHFLLFPFYWALHSIASFKALWQLITKPYYWEKTKHGVSRFA